jgi:hypothetical protein
VSVGDAYDVMTSGRAYQRPKTPAQAREEIARMSGQQFDPVVVRALMNVSLGRLRGATGPVAVLAELPFIRGLPQIGRDAATLLTSSAVMATSMAIGVVPAPATLLPNDIAAAVGELLPGGPEDVETGDPPAVVADDPNPAVTTTTTVAAEPQTDDPPADGEPADVDPDPEGPSPTTTAPPPPTATPVAGSPVAAADAARTSEDTAAIIDVLANDSDPDGDLDASSLAVSKAPSNGAAAVSGSQIRYTPKADFHGSDSVAYQLCDTKNTCSTATITIEVRPVNDAPVGRTTSGRVAEDRSLTLPIETFDVDGDVLSCDISGAPPVGAATVPSDCTRLVFKPSANYFGTVPVKIALSDGEAVTEFVIQVEVTPVNDAPVAANDSASTDWATRVDVPVLANDVDVDGDKLAVTITGAPAAGSATVAGTAIRYTPTFGVGGSFTIQYRACDPSGACDNATVTVTTAAISLVVDDRVEVNKKESVVVPVSSNDTPGSGQWYRPSFRIVTPPSHGRARDLGWGRIAFSPERGYVGTDAVVYELCDTDGSCDTGTLFITIG